MSAILLIGSYLSMHLVFLTSALQRKIVSISYHQTFILLGLGSLSWAAHLLHIALPVNKLLISGISPALLPFPSDLLTASSQNKIFPGFGLSAFPDFTLFTPLNTPLFGLQLAPSTGSLEIGQLAAHHFYLSLVLILSGILASATLPNAVKLNTRDLSLPFDSK
jgi:photosystem I P700 chlorophyll a apoprotein A1